METSSDLNESNANNVMPYEYSESMMKEVVENDIYINYKDPGSIMTSKFRDFCV